MGGEGMKEKRKKDAICSLVFLASRASPANAS